MNFVDTAAYKGIRFETHNTQLFFFTKPQYVLYKRNRNLNEMITSLVIKVFTDYADM